MSDKNAFQRYPETFSKYFKAHDEIINVYLLIYFFPFMAINLYIYIYNNLICLFILKCQKRDI